MIPRCDFCGRFLSEYYKLVECRTFFMRKKYKQQKTISNTVGLCKVCSSTKGMYKHPKNLLTAIEEGKCMKKNSKEHRAIVVKNIKKFLLIHGERKKEGAAASKKKKADRLFKKVQVGVLNREIGMKGYLNAVPGDPVYEINDRYVIYLKKDTPLTHNIYIETEIKYYKSTLQPSIDFINV